jgi:hypothetical protein
VTIVVCKYLDIKRKSGREEIKGVGNGVLSHPVTRAVPSALVSLTSGFGMGPGVVSFPNTMRCTYLNSFSSSSGSFSFALLRSANTLHSLARVPTSPYHIF